MDTSIHLEDVISFIGILITLILFHSRNVQRIRDIDRRLQDRAISIEAKVDLIYEWFKANIIGRGEMGR